MSRGDHCSGGLDPGGERSSTVTVPQSPISYKSSTPGLAQGPGPPSPSFQIPRASVCQARGEPFLKPPTHPSLSFLLLPLSCLCSLLRAWSGGSQPRNPLIPNPEFCSPSPGSLPTLGTCPLQGDTLGDTPGSHSNQAPGFASPPQHTRTHTVWPARVSLGSPPKSGELSDMFMCAEVGGQSPLPSWITSFWCVGESRPQRPHSESLSPSCKWEQISVGSLKSNDQI